MPTPTHSTAVHTGAAGFPVHTFHIPVMGTGFTIDTPLRVAKYGISSVVSLVDDVLIEQIRQYHCARLNEPYEPIADREDDARARRITAYLNLLDRLVRNQFETLRTEPFTEQSDITRYFRLLPDGALRKAYDRMRQTPDAAERARLEAQLRRDIRPGSIDTNIMTKVDRDIYRNGVKLPREYNDAMAALRGFARSTLHASVVLSAGFNPHLYGYINQFDDFLPDAEGLLNKKIILKVSDFRSAAIQSKYMAKRGVWVSEFRIESGLNCGGHAFPTDGYLLGPILEEFKNNREELIGSLHEIYAKGLLSMGRNQPTQPPPVRVTVQGGIGTVEEDLLLRRYYEVDGTGWCTPFLLVPEVSNLDDCHRQLLSEAGEKDIFLSNSSPFGMPFWNLYRSGSEESRKKRIHEGRPGSPCVKGFVMLNTDLGPRPLCTASRTYQQARLDQVAKADMPEDQRTALREFVMAKSCICNDLAGGVSIQYGLDPEAAPAVCSGPNIVNFSKIATLEEMVDHIYGRISLLTSSNRPHMFIREISLYADYLQHEIGRYLLKLSTRTPQYFEEFKQNLLHGVDYYQSFAQNLGHETREKFLNNLQTLVRQIENISIPEPAPA